MSFEVLSYATMKIAIEVSIIDKNLQINIKKIVHLLDICFEPPLININLFNYQTLTEISTTTWLGLQKRLHQRVTARFHICDKNNGL